MIRRENQTRAIAAEFKVRLLQHLHFFFSINTTIMFISIRTIIRLRLPPLGHVYGNGVIRMVITAILITLCKTVSQHVRSVFSSRIN